MCHKLYSAVTCCLDRVVEHHVDAGEGRVPEDGGQQPPGQPPHPLRPPDVGGPGAGSLRGLAAQLHHSDGDGGRHGEAAGRRAHQQRGGGARVRGEAGAEAVGRREVEADPGHGPGQGGGEAAPQPRHAVPGDHGGQGAGEAASLLAAAGLEPGLEEVERLEEESGGHAAEAPRQEGRHQRAPAAAAGHILSLMGQSVSSD